MDEGSGKSKSGDLWKRVPTIKVADRLTAKSSVPTDVSEEVIPASHVRYTIFDLSHVYYDEAMIAELYTATQEAPKFLVAFKPFRMALHSLIVQVSTKLELDDEVELETCVFEISHGHKFLKNFFAIQTSLDIERKKIQEKLRPLVDILLKNKEIVEVNGYSKEEIQAVHNAIKRVKNENVHKLGQYVTGFNHEMAINLLATDALYREHAQNVLDPIVEGLLYEYARAKNIRLINLVPSNEMCEFMVAGGQASGKGSSVDQIIYLAQQRGISWKQIVKVNTDSYKCIILDPNTVRPDIYSQLAQEEASLIHLAVQRKIESLIEKGQGVHHLFVDQVFVGEDKIKLAVKCGGSVFVTIVSTEVDVCIKRSFERGVIAGRFENTQGVLLCHKNMTTQVMGVLSKFTGQNVYVNLVDNNVVKGQQAIPVMLIDLKDKTAEIQDVELLERFIKKTTINENATSITDLYRGDEQKGGPPVEKYLLPLSSAGVSLQYPQPAPEASPVLRGSPGRMGY